MKRASAIVSLSLLLFFCGPSSSAENEPFNPDRDPSRIHWTKLDTEVGPVPDGGGKSFGIVIKTPVNEYWRLMTAGYRKRAEADKITVDIQAAQNEHDVARQLAILHNMLGNHYDALLISPISSENLKPAIEDALSYGVPVVDVDGAVAENVRYFVGPVNLEMGQRAARWFIENVANGGKVAVIEGQAGVLSSVQRSAGFRDVLLATGRFEIAGSLPGDWDKQKAYEAAKQLIEGHPDLIGIYCNNDTMALAAVEAAKDSGRLKTIAIIGSDGTEAAYKSIEAGELTGTVDIFPALIGSIGLEVAQRVAAGQTVPRVVETPQALITRQNLPAYHLPEKALFDLLREQAQSNGTR